MRTTTLTRRALPCLALSCGALTVALTGANALAQEAPAAAHQQPVSWNDTSIGGRYSSQFSFPGNDARVTQKIAFVNSTGGFRYGSYMFNVDFLASDGNNPVAGGTTGAQEVYSVGHVEWSGSKILGLQFNNGFIRDVGLTTGYELSSKNDAYGSRARMLTLGPTLDFAVPRGFWTLTLGARTESNHNGIVHSDVHFDTAWHLESAWGVPVSLGPVQTVFKGFLAMTGPKGKDGFHVDTKTETLTRMAWLVDVGNFFGHPRAAYIGPGYEYWHNMFGTPKTEAAGTQRTAPVLVGEFHF